MTIASSRISCLLDFATGDKVVVVFITGVSSFREERVPEIRTGAVNSNNTRLPVDTDFNGRIISKGFSRIDACTSLKRRHFENIIEKLILQALLSKKFIV